MNLNIKVKIEENYKLYKKNSEYEMFGKLIILSGVNGSGKSQLLNIIANNGKDHINRTVLQFNNGEEKRIEKILLLSFRDNINLGEDFGQFSVTYKDRNFAEAWKFYQNNIKFEDGKDFWNNRKERKYKENKLIFDNDGNKLSSWRSILELLKLLQSYYSDDEIYYLTKDQVEKVLPDNFIWRNENDIVEQVGNLFYSACCDRVNQQIKYSTTKDSFNNSEWLKTAPWTILNQLFDDLKFKYKFKDDYEFHTPYMEENPRLRFESEIRSLVDLSDGEKSILKLALVSLDEEISKDIDLVLFDEYDAPLNPSLIEAFYYVIDKFFVQKGIQVILTTHSSATLSLAPEYASFYELFAQNAESPKLVPVSQYDYSELKIANKTFYDKIKHQDQRINELEDIIRLSGNMLFVEDQYYQIYMIAYLKCKDVDDITEENLESEFKKISNFSIHGGFSAGGLYSRLTTLNISSDEKSKIICVFDFDQEGYLKFEKLSNFKDNKSKVFDFFEESIVKGLCLKHRDADRYALMLPIPDRLSKFVCKNSSSYCFVEIESLLSRDFLEKNQMAEEKSSCLNIYSIKDKCKKNFWKDLLNADKSVFEDFVPLFDAIETIFMN